MRPRQRPDGRLIVQLSSMRPPGLVNQGLEHRHGVAVDALGRHNDRRRRLRANFSSYEDRDDLVSALLRSNEGTVSG